MPILLFGVLVENVEYVEKKFVRWLCFYFFHIFHEGTPGGREKFHQFPVPPEPMKIPLHFPEIGKKPCVF